MLSLGNEQPTGKRTEFLWILPNISTSLPQESLLPNGPLVGQTNFEFAEGGTNQRRRLGVDALGELVSVGEVAPQHLVLAGGGDTRGRLPHDRLPVYAPPLRVLRHLLQRRQDCRRCIPATDCKAPLNPRPEPNQCGYRWGGGRTCEKGGTRRPRRESASASHSPSPPPGGGGGGE
jgi:hypothetical protein